MNVNTIWQILVTSGQEWGRNKAPLFSAAISFYTLFSLAPLLLITLVIASLVFDQDQLRAQFITQINDLAGHQAAQWLIGVLHRFDQQQTGLWPALIGFVVMLLGSSTVFLQLRHALNLLWDVQPQPGRGLWTAVWNRLFSIGIVLMAGLLLICLFLLGIVIAAFSQTINTIFPLATQFMQLLGWLVNLIFMAGLFSVMFNYLPSCKVPWLSTLLGGVLTALLFSLGQVGIGLYLKQRALVSAYGAAAALIILLLYVYYSAMIFFYGAAFTKVLTYRQSLQQPDPSPSMGYPKS